MRFVQTSMRCARRHRVTGAALASVVALATLTSCAEEPKDAGAKGGAGITVGLTYTPNIQFSPFYVAAEKGYYKDAGLKVTLRHHGAAEDLFGALSSGKEDVIYAGGDEMLQARAKNVPVVDIATFYQKYPVGLIVPKDSEIRTPADLKGRKIGTPGPSARPISVCWRSSRRAAFPPRRPRYRTSASPSRPPSPETRSRGSWAI